MQAFKLDYSFLSHLYIVFIYSVYTISFIHTHFVFPGISVVFFSSRSDNVIKNNITNSRSEENKYISFSFFVQYTSLLMKFVCVFVWLVFIYLFIYATEIIYSSFTSLVAFKNERVKFCISLFILFSMSNILNGFSQPRNI